MLYGCLNSVCVEWCINNVLKMFINELPTIFNDVWWVFNVAWFDLICTCIRMRNSYVFLPRVLFPSILGVQRVARYPAHNENVFELLQPTSRFEAGRSAARCHVPMQIFPENDPPHIVVPVSLAYTEAHHHHHLICITTSNSQFDWYIMFLLLLLLFTTG